jgi:hypothetical protein
MLKGIQIPNMRGEMVASLLSHGLVVDKFPALLEKKSNLNPI